MPDKFEFYYRCFCCGYLVSDIEYESAIAFVRCPRCHAGVENFVPEAHLTKRAPDVLRGGHCEHVPDGQYCPYCKEA